MTFSLELYRSIEKEPKRTCHFVFVNQTVVLLLNPYEIVECEEYKPAQPAVSVILLLTIIETRCTCPGTVRSDDMFS